MNKPLRQHSHDSHNSILNHSLNKSILTAAEDTHLHGGNLYLLEKTTNKINYYFCLELTIRSTRI